VTLTLRKLEQELLAAGHAVCVLTTVSGDSKNTHLDGEHVNRQVLFLDNSIPIPFLNDPNNPTLSYQLGFSLSRTIRQQLDDFEPTLIHIAVPDCTALHMVQYARQKEIPLMGTYHSNIPEYMDHYPGLGWLKPILWGFFRHQYNFYQALYVPTPYISNFLCQTQKMDRITSLQVWGRGVDVQQFTPQKRNWTLRRDVWGVSDKEVVLCWCGRLVPEKRVDIFCDTVQRLDALGVPFRAVVVGAGPCEDQIKALPRTIFAGWMTPDELAVAYASADVFLFPSSVETFGNVTLEAMASGLPVVVEEGCSGHLVHQEENGFACPAGDADAFFEGTRRLVVDHALRQAYSQRSRELSLSMEKRAVVQQMLTNYTQVTRSFFTEYGGRHSNRDAAFRKPHSFVAGNHPRPILLRVVEWLFIVLFRIIWNMTELFFAMQRTVLAYRPLRPSSTTTATSSNSPRSTPVNSPKRTPTKRASFEPSTSSSLSPTRRLRKMEESSSPSHSIVELQDVDLQSNSSVTDPLLSHQETSDDSDCDTDTTASLGNDSSSSSSTSSIKKKAIGDDRVSIALSTGFIRSAEYLCRMESSMRNTCTSSPMMSSILMVGRKRKNSSMENDVEADGGQLMSQDSGITGDQDIEDGRVIVVPEISGTTSRPRRQPTLSSMVVV
jgi:glycosyltransferase involved in cell wall biosynthesis